MEHLKPWGALDLRQMDINDRSPSPPLCQDSPTCGSAVPVFYIHRILIHRRTLLLMILNNIGEGGC